MGNLLLPILLLCGSLAGGLIVLRIDARHRHLTARVAVVAGGASAASAGRSLPGGIRMTLRPQGSVVGWLLNVLRMSAEVPEANVIPPWLVIVTGIAGGFATYFVARLHFGAAAALPEAMLCAVFLIRGLFGWQKRRYATRLVNQLPDVIELLSATVTAGLPAVQGLRTIRDEMPPPTKEQFDQVLQEISLGAGADIALVNLFRRTGVVEYSILGVTLGVQSKSGGRLVETVQTLAETIRQRLAIAARGNALAAEAKLSAYVIAAMPIVGGIVMSIIQPGYLDPLFHDPRGNMMLFIAIVLLSSGIYIMAKMIRLSLSE